MALFIPNPTVEEQVQHDPFVEHNIEHLAEEGLSIAQRLVPVDTGELQDSLHIEDMLDGGKAIVAGTDHWLFPEFGTSDQSAQPYLRPIIDELGLHR